MPHLVPPSVNTKGRGQALEPDEPSQPRRSRWKASRVQLRDNVEIVTVLAYTMCLCCCRNPLFTEIILIC